MESKSSARMPRAAADFIYISLSRPFYTRAVEAERGAEEMEKARRRRRRGRVAHCLRFARVARTMP